MNPRFEYPGSQPSVPEAKELSKNAILFVASFAGVIYPIILAGKRYGATAAAFKFFANDAFYYLNVARRSFGSPFYTYDGAHPTNGFHPLWQWVLSFTLGHLGLVEASDAQIRLDFALCALASALGIAFLAIALARITNSHVLAFVAVVPGFYDLLMSRMSISVVDVTETAPWSFANGMESGLSVLFFGIFVWWLFRTGDLETATPSKLVGLSCVLTLSTLSRLDDVFLLVAFVGAVAIASHGTRDLARRVLAASAIPAVSLGLYILHNLRTVGLALPVSGMTKESGAAWLGNARAVGDTLFPSLLWTAHYSFEWDVVAWRVFQLIVPVAVACAYLAYMGTAKRAAGPGGLRRNLMLLSCYVLFKGLYNLLLVPLVHQGHWYFPVSIEIVNILIAYGLGLVWRGLTAQSIDLDPAVLPSRVVWAVRSLGAIVLLAAVSLVSVFVAKRTSEIGGPGLSHVKLLVAAFGTALAGGILVVSAPRYANSVAQFLIRPPPRPSLIVAGIWIVYTIATGNAVVNQKADGHYCDLSYDFWQRRHEVDETLAALGAAGHVFELDDGIIGYALQRPTMNAMGLSIDRGALAAFRERRCFDVAYQRGFNVLSSLTYWSYLNEQRSQFRRPRTDDEILSAIVGKNADFSLPDCARELYSFSVLRRIELGAHSMYFLGFRPVTTNPAATDALSGRL